MNGAVTIYDTTLRDGARARAISFSVEDKLKIAAAARRVRRALHRGRLAGLERQGRRVLPPRPLGPAEAGAGRRVRLDAARGHRPARRTARSRCCWTPSTPVVTIVGKSWDLHVHHVLETTLDENLAMIGDTRALSEGAGPAGVLRRRALLRRLQGQPRLRAGVRRGRAGSRRRCSSCCARRTAGRMPWEVEEIVRATRERYLARDDRARPRSASTRTTTRAWRWRTRWPRCGRARRRCRARSTASASGWATATCAPLIPNLQLKLGVRCLDDDQLARLTELSRFASETANLAPNPRQPYVGASAFAHKGGIHVAAVLKVEHSYQHIDPTLVGNERRVLVSELSGRGNLVYKAQEFGVDASKEEVAAGAGPGQGAGEPRLLLRGRGGVGRADAAPAQAGLPPAVRADRLHGRGGAPAGPRHLRRGQRQGARWATRSCTRRPRATAR